jgi:hypothetical protein
MSVYATSWRLRFPRTGDAYEGCQWVDVFAQGVPAHIGTPTPGSNRGWSEDTAGEWRPDVDNQGLILEVTDVVWW